MDTNTHFVNEITVNEMVKKLVVDIEASTQTIEEYCLIAALGSVAKQLEAFNKHSDISNWINQYLDDIGFPHQSCGAKINIED